MTDYAKGFKDGFAAGLEEGKKIVEDQWRLEKIKELEKSLPNPIKWPYTTQEIKEKCPKCGISLKGVMNYVCSSPNCPTFPQVTCGTPMTGQTTWENVGAVGSAYKYDARGWRIE